MPLTRYRIRNEYGLADPDTYRSADKEDPEALLEGVAMAGLVGLLRQLGDLAEFAAEIFHDLHEEVLATAARGHGLTVRIQQLEAEFPPIEKALLMQTAHSSYFSNPGVEWHPNLQMEQNLIARGDLPRFVMDSYEESRGPPRLFLLDKFDVAGAGACLKRYTDPSFFKVETVSDNLTNIEIQREKRVRKLKKKGSRWRNGETPEAVPASHAKLHQLFLEERIENAYSDPARRVKLKRRQLNESPFDSKSRKSYMEKFVESPSPESKTICEVPVVPLSLEWTQDDTSEQGPEVMEFSSISPVKEIPLVNDQHVSPFHTEEKRSMDDFEFLQSTINGERDEISSIPRTAVEEKKLMVCADGEGSMAGYNSDEVTSEVENYMDALAAIESDDGNSSYGRNSSSLCTDGLSNMGYSSQIDGHRFSNVLSPPASIVTGSGNMPDDQLPYRKEAFETKSEELTTMNVEDDAIRYLREASHASSSANLESPVCNESSNSIEVATGLPDADQTIANLVDSIPLDSDDLPDQLDDDTIDAASTGCLPVAELEDGDSRVGSMDMEHSLSDLELVSESESRNTMLNAEDVESCDGKLSRLSLEESHQSLEHAGENGPDARTFSSVSSPRNSGSELVPAIIDEVTVAILAPAVDLEKPTVFADERQIHVDDQTLLDDVVVNEKNISHLDLQHEGGDTEDSQTLDCENIYSLTNNVVEDGRELEPLVSVEIPNEGCDDCSNSGACVLPRVGLEETTASADESLILVDKELMGETQKLVLHDENQPEVEVRNEERSYQEITQAGEKDNSGTCIIEGLDGVTAPPVPLIGDNSILDDLVKQEVQEVDVGISRSPDADIGGSPQEKLNLYEAEYPVWMKETGVDEKVKEAGISHAFSDSISATDWDPEAYGHNSIAVSASGSSLSEQKSDSAHDFGARQMDLERENSEHLLSRMDNAVTSAVGFPGSSLAVAQSSMLVVDEPAVDLHLADNVNPFQVEQVPSEDHLDQSTAFMLKEYNLGLQEEAPDTDVERVTGAIQWQGSDGSHAQSPDSVYQEKKGGSPENMLVSLSFQQPSLSASLQGSEFNTRGHNFGLLSDSGEVNLPEMPPLPPLPPVQWRMGKALNAPSTPEQKFPGFGMGIFPMFEPSVPDKVAPQIGFPSLKEGSEVSHNPFLSSAIYSETDNHDQPYSYAMQMSPVELDSGSQSLVMEGKPLPGSIWPENASNESSEQNTLTSDKLLIQFPSSQSLSEGNLSEQNCGSPPVELEHVQPQDPSLLAIGKEAKDLQEIHEDGNEHNSSDPVQKTQEQQNSLNSQEERVSSPDPWALPPTNEGGKPNGTLVGNIPRPPKPLIEAVAAHDRSKLRKVSERVRPQLAPKAEERDSLLEQIRTKSFNLKPAPVSRPSIQQGPRTNLKVAAILEKANAIRQALAGSDEDDDADWSE